MPKTTDKTLNNKTIKIGLRNKANMFQVVRGNFYAGVEIKNIPQHIRGILSGFLKTPKFVLLKAVRRVTVGLCTGASDNVGFTMVTVCDLVKRNAPSLLTGCGGKCGECPLIVPTAIFTAVENKQVKEPFRDGQEEFLKMVADAGGISGVNRDGKFEWYSELKWREGV